MNEFIDAGSTDVQVRLQFLDAATGNPVTVTAATPNLEITVWREGASVLVFYTALTGTAIVDRTGFDAAHVDAGILVLNDGLHQFDIPDADVAAGTARVFVMGHADGIDMVPLTIFLAPGPAVVGLTTAALDDIGDVVSARGAIPRGVELSNFEFIMVSSTDHVTPLPGITEMVIERSIDGGAYANTVNGQTEVGGGTYVTNVHAADLDGGVVTLRFSATGADTRHITFITRPAA